MQYRQPIKLKAKKIKEAWGERYRKGYEYSTEVHLPAERMATETTMCIVRVPEIGFTLCINILFGMS